MAYYQRADFAADSHIMVLIPKTCISQWACIFVATMLSQYYGIFGHGRANSLQRVGKTRILLPVANDDKPDWEYMKQYGKMIQAQQVCTYLDYLENRVRGK